MSIFNFTMLVLASLYLLYAGMIVDASYNLRGKIIFNVLPLIFAFMLGTIAVGMARWC